MASNIGTLVIEITEKTYGTSAYKKSYTRISTILTTNRMHGSLFGNSHITVIVQLLVKYLA